MTTFSLSLHFSLLQTQAIISRIECSRTSKMKRNEIAVQYLVSPLETQIDSGHGGLAEVFRMSAQNLEKFRTVNPLPYLQLPENFLYRHAIELYLKAIIITIHRTRRLSYGSHAAKGMPYLQVGSKWNPLHKEHSLANLYMYAKQLIARSRKARKMLGECDWDEMTPKLDVWIRLIDKADISATLFRYPTTGHSKKDRSKSSWAFIAPTVAISDAVLKGRGGIYNLSPRPKQSYRYVRTPQRRLSVAIRRSANLLSTAHDCLRRSLSK
jgi:hypothetical protein